jgi:dTDP-4-amino-4,6-dideoxygalactose transaminase
MKIQIANPQIDNEEIEQVISVLSSKAIAQGPKVEEFEQLFATYIGVKHAIAVNSGTAALHISLLAHEIGKGDEVITTPFSFIATANSILYTGAKPVFVDIRDDDFDIDVVQIEEKLTAKTKAILPVHLFGQPADMKTIRGIARDYDLIVIEDACQAHGAECDGKKVGTFGTGCFSFYPTKNMTTGEGGMITTDDDEVATRARMIRNHGSQARYCHQLLGYNYRMTDIAAAIGICQLRKLDQFNNRRIANAEFLTDEMGRIEGLIPPYIKPHIKHVFHQYTVMVTDDFSISRDELAHELAERGIETAIYYPMPIHRQPLYRDLVYQHQLPVSERAAQEVLSLPVHPSLTKEDLEYISQALRHLIKVKV